MQFKYLISYDHTHSITELTCFVCLVLKEEGNDAEVANRAEGGDDETAMSDAGSTIDDEHEQGLAAVADDIAVVADKSMPNRVSANITNCLKCHTYKCLITIGKVNFLKILNFYLPKSNFSLSQKM